MQKTKNNARGIVKYMIKAIELNMMAKTIENSLIVTLIKSSNTGKQFNFKRPRSFFQLLFQFSICKGKEFLCHSLLKKDPTLTQLRPLTRIFYVTNYPDIRGHGWKWQDVLKREIQIVPAEYHLIPSCFRFFLLLLPIASQSDILLSSVGWLFAAFQFHLIFYGTRTSIKMKTNKQQRISHFFYNSNFELIKRV